MEKALTIIAIVFNLIGAVALFISAHTIFPLSLGAFCAFLVIFLTVSLFQKKESELDSSSIPRHKPTEDWVEWHSDTPL